MATIAPKPVIELDLNGSDWQNLTSGITAHDGADVMVQADGNIRLEKHSNAMPDTKGLAMNPQNVYVFTKVASYNVWAKGTGSIRLESAK